MSAAAASLSTSLSRPQTYPKEMVDAHHHFLNTHPKSAGGNGDDFQAFLASILPNERYLPDQYYQHVVLPLQQHGISLTGSVHVECMPDDGPAEVAWVEQLSASRSHNGTVQAIVGSVDLTQTDVDDALTRLKQASPLVKGVRWILDCVGPYQPNTATHVGTTRHDGRDYMRGSHGPQTFHGTTVPEFERGFACLAQHGLSYDLQCAPVQLIQAAQLCARHPHVPVVIDHLGKPRMLLGPDTDNDSGTDNDNKLPNAQELEHWRMGMRAMAQLPHVYVKLSMLGYAVPGWKKDSHRTALLQQLIRETVAMFTPKRCMVALNWWKNAAVSDSDFLSNVGPTPMEYVDFILDCLHDYSEQDRDRIFAGTAREFYR